MRLVLDKVKELKVENTSSTIQNEAVPNKSSCNDDVPIDILEDDLAQPQPRVKNKRFTVEQT